MAGNKLTINLTGDQQKQIQDATGKSITDLYIDLAALGELSDAQLDQAAGGFDIENPTTIGSVSTEAGWGK
jgi:hypothetical protein